MAQKLTAKLVKNARHSGKVYVAADGSARPAKEVLWDTEVPGLGLRLFPGGRRAWVLRYTLGGRERLAKLANRALTVEEARELAHSALHEQRRSQVLGAEIDPLRRRRRGKTVQEVSEWYLKALADRVRPSSLAKYRESVVALVAAMGSVPVENLQETDARRAFATITRERGPYAANRALSVLAGLIAFAMRDGLRPRSAPDPLAGIRRNQERRRGLELTGEQIARLGRELELEEALRPGAADTVTALRLLFLTGCRRREITDLRWAEVDLEGRCLRLSQTKTGPRTAALSTAAARVLASLPRNGERVFPGDRHKVEFAVQYTWKRVRTRAGLENVRIHDLRHSYVTRGLSAGYSEALVGKAVGHASAATTRRYSHLSLDPVREVAERLGSEIAADLEGAPAAKVEQIGNGVRR